MHRSIHHFCRIQIVLTIHGCRVSPMPLEDRERDVSAWSCLKPLPPPAAFRASCFLSYNPGIGANRITGLRSANRDRDCSGLLGERAWRYTLIIVSITQLSLSYLREPLSIHHVFSNARVSALPDGADSPYLALHFPEIFLPHGVKISLP